MIIAIPVESNQKEVCVSFGRAPLFCIYNTDSKEEAFVENAGATAPGGAGLKSAQCAIDQGVDTIITVRCGENAAEVFQEMNIQIYKAQGVNVAENIEMIMEGKLDVLDHFHKGFHGIQ